MRDKRTYGKVVAVDVEIYDNCKYEKESKVVEMARYNNLESWEIVSGEDAKEIENEIVNNGLDADTNNEYLVLHLEDGNTATYRNSFVEMFRYYGKGH